MIVLGLDTALSACSVAVVDGGRVLARLSEPMTRGHQERLAPMVEEAMAAAGLGFGQLDRVGVTVGPGSFTGLRVGLAFAKGLALALDIPCVGAGSLPALAAGAEAQGPVAACIDAKHGQVYLEVFEAGASRGEAQALTLEDAVARLSGLGAVVLVGSGAPLLAPRLPLATVEPRDAAEPTVVARLAAAAVDPRPPVPIYLRAPDARRPPPAGGGVKLRLAEAADAEALARAHARSFDDGWNAADIGELMTAMGGFAVLAENDDGPIGFILGRAIGGEAEILTLAVAPGQRRKGLGHALVEALVVQARARGAGAVYLEVAADNTAAQALYAKAGFARAGFRRGYYARGGARPVDALVLRRTLNSLPT